MFLAHLPSEYIIPDMCGLAAVVCNYEETIPDKIIKSAIDYGVDVNTALRIAKAESGYNALAKNPISSAAGVYQITRATADETSQRMGNGWGYKDVYNAERNIEMAMYLMSKGEFWRWVTY